MSETLRRIEAHLTSGNFAQSLTEVFCRTLYWGAPRGLTPRVLEEVGAPINATLTIHPVAQLSGLPVLRVDWPEDRLPGVTARRAVQKALKPLHAEHLLCYTTRNGQQVAFTWARQRPDGKTELRTMPYEVGSPARTTIERLGELAFSLGELESGEPSITVITDKLNRAFSVEAVTKRFYQELANWFFWARDQVDFPMPATEKNREAYISQSLIRLITRLIFCWFMKEMGLIPRELFDRRTLSTLLKDGANLPTSEKTTFYKAILQNLFFATLNQEIGKRQFRKRNKDPRGRDPHWGITNLYRYEDYFTNPDEFLQLVKNIPFLNGGLFECLDQVYRTEENRPTIRIDGFSDHPNNPLSVPDYLFFGEERRVDLSDAYGESRYETVCGLIHIFNRYNFTVTESTPLDQEVALDPELAGKVFENLLAAYNPETATTARKATGSYYTPRPIVEFMVDESLIAYLKTQLETAHPDAPTVEARLRHLLAYHDELPQFSPEEVETLITAIDNLKAIDPACGSGAFPMGLLHKLVFILSKLDPRNKRWKERQIAKASEIPDTTIREKVIADIEQTFAAGELDYGRKLYLIENCIYGVDIQPIAVQIAKMRFFISLTVDQKADPSAPNLGIRPLPNLETKFVAANTLIGIERPAQLAFRNPKIDELEQELKRVREQHFTARTQQTKQKCRERDAQLRAQIAELLKNDGWGSATAEQLAAWDPYDQNASADFFDPEWMFGIRDGFDIVMGTPPYGVKILGADMQRIRPRIQDTKNSNSAAIFIDVAKNILTHNNGVVSLVVPKSLLYSERWFSLVKALAPNTISLVDMEQAFENVLLEQVVFVYCRSRSVPKYRTFKFRGGEFLERALVPLSCVSHFRTWPCDVDERELQLGIKISRSGIFLRDVSKSFRGFGLQQKLAPTGEYPVIGGKNILRYGINGYKGYVRQSEFASVAKKVTALLQPKVISQQIVAHIQNPKPHIMIMATVDHTGEILGLDTVENTVPMNQAIHLNMIAALFNSTLINWYAYRFIYCSAVRTMHFDDHYIGKIPLPVDYEDQQQPIISLVDKILAAKQSDPHADVTALEREIDQIVYQLYELTEEEIKIVEGLQDENDSGV